MRLQDGYFPCCNTVRQDLTPNAEDVPLPMRRHSLMETRSFSYLLLIILTRQKPFRP